MRALAGPLEQLQETAQAIGDIQQEARLPVDAGAYTESFKPYLMDVIYQWSKAGARFFRIRLTFISVVFSFSRFYLFFCSPVLSHLIVLLRTPAMWWLVQPSSSVPCPVPPVHTCGLWKLEVVGCRVHPFSTSAHSRMRSRAPS